MRLKLSETGQEVAVFETVTEFCEAATVFNYFYGEHLVNPSEKYRNPMHLRASELNEHALQLYLFAPSDTETMLQANGIGEAVVGALRVMVAMEYDPGLAQQAENLLQSYDNHTV